MRSGLTTRGVCVSAKERRISRSWTRSTHKKLSSSLSLSLSLSLSCRTLNPAPSSFSILSAGSERAAETGDEGAGRLSLSFIQRFRDTSTERETHRPPLQGAIVHILECLSFSSSSAGGERPAKAGNEAVGQPEADEGVPGVPGRDPQGDRGGPPSPRTLYPTLKTLQPTPFASPLSRALSLVLSLSLSLLSLSLVLSLSLNPNRSHP